MNVNSENKTILIAPLNWGLGHATRCIPIIKALEENNYIPIIASDGASLDLLRKEFPYLRFLELPSYQIEYPKNGNYFKWKLLANLPKILGAIYKEKKIVSAWIQKYKIDGIISDNRIGVYCKRIPSVFITHQLQVLSGNTSWLTSKIHQNCIKNFNECWVPDVKGKPNLTGELGHLAKTNLNLKYIGPLSRFYKKTVSKKYDLMVILSGPEPQRTILEEKLKEELTHFDGEVIFIKGLIETSQKKEKRNRITYYNFMNTRQLEQVFNESEMVLCRAGYTSIMDLTKLEKKAFFIPTPGQYEQEYLAEKLKLEGLVPFATQDEFKIDNLSEIGNYKGLPIINSEVNWKSLFTIFK